MRIPVPSFELALATLLEVVAESPDHVSGHTYLDSEGYPADITAHALNRLDAPMLAFQGNRPHHVIAKARAGVPGTPYNQVRFPLVWDRLFYDHDDTMFLGMRDDVEMAERFLVYALFGHIVDPQGRGRYAVLTWRHDLIRGLKSFHRFLNSPYSGFLVQTHGNHEQLWYDVDSLTAAAIAALEN